MKVELIRIGNSRCIRIPKPFIEQCGLREAIDLRVENNCLIIAPERSTPRKGWDVAFKTAGPADSDELLLANKLQNEFDRHEWSW
ncbi:MAG: AbrB/MazE/SpoVT family DNA-binding domain-containing protein [Bryobacteraceae bacterium]